MRLFCYVDTYGQTEEQTERKCMVLTNIYMSIYIEYGWESPSRWWFIRIMSSMTFFKTNNCTITWSVLVPTLESWSHPASEGGRTAGPSRRVASAIVATGCAPSPWCVPALSPKYSVLIYVCNKQIFKKGTFRLFLKPNFLIKFHKRKPPNFKYTF